MTAVNAEGRDVVMLLAKKLKTGKLPMALLGILVFLTIASVVLGHTLPQKAAWVGTAGTVVFPLFLAAWSVLDLIAQRFEAAKVNEIVEFRIREALNRVKDQLSRIAQTPQKEWSPSRVKAQQEDILDCVVKLLKDAGVNEPRVCLYRVNLDDHWTNETGDQLQGRAETLPDRAVVDELEYVTHRGGDRKPKDLYLRRTTNEGVQYESRRNRVQGEAASESGCEGLFEPIETRNFSYQLRPGFDPVNHHWRASARLPVFVGAEEIEYLLTADTSGNTVIESNYEGLLGIGTTMLSLLTSMKDEEIPGDVPTMIRRRVTIAVSEGGKIGDSRSK